MSHNHQRISAVEPGRLEGMPTFKPTSSASPVSANRQRNNDPSKTVETASPSKTASTITDPSNAVGNKSVGTPSKTGTTAQRAGSPPTNPNRLPQREAPTPSYLDIAERAVQVEDKRREHGPHTVAELKAQRPPIPPGHTRNTLGEDIPIHTTLTPLPVRPPTNPNRLGRNRLPSVAGVDQEGHLPSVTQAEQVMREEGPAPGSDIPQKPTNPALPREEAAVDTFHFAAPLQTFEDAERLVDSLESASDTSSEDEKGVLTELTKKGKPRRVKLSNPAPVQPPSTDGDPREPLDPKGWKRVERRYWKVWRRGFAPPTDVDVVMRNGWHFATRGAPDPQVRAPKPPGNQAGFAGALERRSQANKSHGDARLTQWILALQLKGAYDWYCSTTNETKRELLRAAYDADIRKGPATSRHQAYYRLLSLSVLEDWEWDATMHHLTLLDAIWSCDLTGRNGIKVAVHLPDMPIDTIDTMPPEDILGAANTPRSIFVPVWVEFVFRPPTDDAVLDEYKEYLALVWARIMHAMNGNMMEPDMFDVDMTEVPDPDQSSVIVVNAIDPPHEPARTVDDRDVIRGMMQTVGEILRGELEPEPHKGDIIPAAVERRADAPQPESTIDYIGSLLHAAGYNYLGPGNFGVIDGVPYAATPVDALDKLAMLHDIAYDKALSLEDIQRADQMFIAAARALGTPMSYIAAGAIAAKDWLVVYPDLSDLRKATQYTVERRNGLPPPPIENDFERGKTDAILGAPGARSLHAVGAWPHMRKSLQRWHDMDSRHPIVNEANFYKRVAYLRETGCLMGLVSAACLLSRRDTNCPLEPLRDVRCNMRHLADSHKHYARSNLTGHAAYMQATNNARRHAENGNTAQERIDQSIELIQKYCSKPGNVIANIAGHQSVYKAAQIPVYINGRPTFRTVAPRAGANWMFNDLPFWDAATNAYVNVYTDPYESWWRVASHAGPGLPLQISGLGDEIIVQAGQGVFNRLRTNTAIINVPALADVASQTIDANDSSNIAYNTQPGITTDIPLKILMMDASLNYGPVEDHTPWLIAGNISIPEDNAFDLGAYFPGSTNAAGGTNIAMAYVDINVYAQMLRQNNQQTQVGAGLLPFIFSTWDVTTAVVFVNGARLNPATMALFALAHMEYPFRQKYDRYGTWDTTTLAFPAANLSGTSSDSRVVDRWRIDGPRDRILFVELEPRFDNQPNAINVGGAVIAMNAPAPVNITYTNMWAALLACTSADYQSALDWWYHTVGTEEELRFAKVMLATTCKAFYRLPFYTQDTDVTFGGLRALTNTIDDLSLADYNNQSYLDVSRDWYSPLGIPAYPIASVRLNGAMCSLSRSGAAVRGVLAFGICYRGTRTDNTTRWVWSYQDKCDVLRAADCMTVMADAMEQTSGLDPHEATWYPTNSYTHQVQVEDLHSRLRAIGETFLGINVLTHAGDLALYAVASGLYVAPPQMARYVPRFPTIAMPDLGYHTELDFGLSNDRITYAMAGDPGPRWDGCEPADWDYLNEREIIKFKPNDFDRSPAIMRWLGWVPYIEAKLQVAQFPFAASIYGRIVSAFGSIVVPAYVVCSTIQYTVGFPNAWVPLLYRNSILASTAPVCSTFITESTTGTIAVATLSWYATLSESGLLNTGGTTLNAMAFTPIAATSLVINTGVREALNLTRKDRLLKPAQSPDKTETLTGLAQLDGPADTGQPFPGGGQ